VQIEPWQVPVLVMTVVILPPSAVWAVRRLQGGTVDARPPTRRPATTPATEQAEEVEKDVTKGRFRTSVLAVLTAVLLGLFFLAIGTEQANLLTSAATAVSTSVSAALTVRSFLDVKDLKEDVRKLGAQGETDRAGRGVEPGKKPERQ
jgi:hypothetical protein